MGLFIKNPEVERKARELARRTGESLTGAIEAAIDQRMARLSSPERPHPTLEEVRAATDEFRRVSGLDKAPYRPFTRADWDALWPTSVPEIDEA